jgi:spermidine synthase
MRSLTPDAQQGVVELSVLVTLALLNFALLRFYEVRRGDGTRSKWRTLIAPWDFSPQSLGGFTHGKLVLVSVLTLFLELLMIRWVSSEVRIFAYFKNFVLVACFLGFGVGCYLNQRRANLLALVTPLVTVAALIKLPSDALRSLVTRLPDYIGGFSTVAIWDAPRMAFSWSAVSDMIAASAISGGLFALVAFAFIPLGQLVGWYLENANRGTWGYSENILGSLAGIGLFTLLSFLDQPPASWFVSAGVMVVALVWRNPTARWTAVVSLGLCAALAGLTPGGGTTYWSPYQKLTITPKTQRGTDELISYTLNTNGTWYQHIINLSPEFVTRHPKLFLQGGADWESYNLPYHFYTRPSAVLVLGAGMGNDVAAALRHGAGRVVAVEIDPLILELGRRLHFERPYSSPRVHVVVDDARSYVQNGSERFDLIMFSLLDSHTTSSSYSNIRIDNYVYTLEAMRAARRLLKPDGVFIVKFQVASPFIAGRLQELLKEVFGSDPVQLQSDDTFYTTPGRFFIAGSGQRIDRALADPTLAAYYKSHHDFQTEAAPVTTDDWPYFYQRLPGLPASVAVISALLLAIGACFLRATGISATSVRWHFFFLGAGFMLLEAQIISKMALLFGTTWVVNSIVISGLLLLIVGANLLAEWKRTFPIAIAYAGIFGSLLAAYLIPVETFLFASVWVKALTATLVLCLPVLFAGIVFIRSFARAGFSGTALGSNLLGALVGGLLESLSLWTGIRSLLIVAGACYVASWIALRPRKQAVQTAATSLPLQRVA